MAIGDTTLTVVGNLTGDVDLKFTPSGVAVAVFTVASTRRVHNQATGKWEDGDTLFLRCSAWRTLGEHAAETLLRGTRVIVVGRLKQRDYEDREGIKRTVFEVDVEEVGPSLRYATAKVAKATRDRAPHPADDPAASSQWDTGPASGTLADTSGDPPF